VAISSDNFNTIHLCQVVLRDNRKMNKTSRKYKFVEIGVEIVNSDFY